ncbi:hypothetical protein C9374_002889 [Naegleria lovaniensis]|uniref:Uncharacterized protein n=1 Tax=Naegleria lovaniensis TaxID=51637 RepID=A0AA88GRX2_NAELO|nr:uncharacterized protein C9374_002889 [Naegleria lovaniensis]KAG2385740.1 hypothetical protein C9374_002889 [Naegleria lovaniensis]
MNPRKTSSQGLLFSSVLACAILLMSSLMVMAHEYYVLESFNGTNSTNGSIPLNSTIVPSNSTFVWDFWEINQYPIVGVLIVGVIGIVIAIVVGVIYWYRKRKERLEASEHADDDMHRLEDE